MFGQLRALRLLRADPLFVPQALVPTPTDGLTVADAQPALDAATTAAPHGIFHVPEAL